MRSEPFGGTGVAVPVMGQGTWRLHDKKAAAAALARGLDLGLTHVDTAELYTGSEQVIAGVLADRARDDVFIASKVLPQNASAAGTVKACEATLKRLGTDHVDLYYLHWWSDRHPLADTMRAMEDLVAAGKVKAIGVSNFGVAELEEARAALSRHDIVANQVLHNLDQRDPENELIPHCVKEGIAFVSYSPLGGEGGFPRAASKRGRVLTTIADRFGVTAQQVALARLAALPVFLIPKTESVAHVEANAAALDVALTADDVAAIDAAFPLP